MPKGDEKLLVARFLFILNKDKELEEMASKMKTKLEVENILQKNHINKSSYLSLVHQGIQASYEELIKELFEFEYNNSKVNQAIFDISSVVNHTFDLKLTLIKYELLDQWLPESEDKSNSANMDDTVTQFNLMKSWQKKDDINSDKVKEENEKNYWRCVNIIQV